jgi:GTP-binding protein
MKPIVSIVGRPNVGKSSLFNRLIGHRKAITEDTPGVTRDRNYGEFEYDGRDYVLVDTGGFEPSKLDGFFPMVTAQIEASIQECTVILFVLDGKDGMIPLDVEIDRILRKSEKPVLYVVNKVDSEKREMGSHEFYALGAGMVFPISALHGIGVGELLDGIVEATKPPSAHPSIHPYGDEPIPPSPGDDMAGIKIAMVGRPNTGKSSLTNRLLRSDRMIVSEIPGTTRDAIDSKIRFRKKDMILVDTAGLRRKSRISLKVEEHSVAAAINSIERATVVNLVIDAAEGVSHQDAGIAHVIVTKGRGICVVVNKWDLVQDRMTERVYAEMVRERMPHASFAPVLFTSAVTGKNIEKLLDVDLRVYSQMTKRITTPKLNRAFAEFFQRHSLSYVQGKQIKIPYAHQANTAPPTFILFANYPELIPEHYKRYLENCLREEYGFSGTPIRLVFKKK